MLLSVNPTGAGGGIDDLQLPGSTTDPGIGGVHDTLPISKKYLSLKDVERINQEQFEQQMKELQDCEEMKEIRRVNRQWERELEEDDDDSFSSLGSDQSEGDGVLSMEDQEMKDEEKTKKREPKVKGLKAILGGLPSANDF
jgi:hypothetical protein